MKILSSLAIGAVSVSCFLGANALMHRDRLYTYNDENVLGTSLELKIAAGSEKSADKAEGAVLAEIQRESKILSSYDKTSELSRWFATRGQAIPISSELFDNMQLFDQWRVRTNGALDASAEVISRAWKTAAAADRMPTEEELVTAVAAVKQQHWSLDAAAQTATHTSDTPLAFNSFVKSYIIDRAADAALASGNVSGVVVNIGGDLVVRGNISEPVHVSDPLSDAENGVPIARLVVRDRAIATSGNYRRGVDIQGRHYSHIVDPRTGQPADRILSATVIARNPVDAGALATSFSVMDPVDSRKLASSMPGVEFLLVQKDGSHVESVGWRHLAAPAMDLALATPPPAPAPYVPQAGAWNPGFELVVNLELAHFDMPVRRPYVAIWIEDKDRFPLRTVALWQQKPRYLTDLKNWYREDNMRRMAESNDLIATLSSATRSPGKYTVKWDGKDNQGKLVKAGTYTVNIEAAREHGTYQMMKQEMDFSGTPKQVQLPGGTEIASATLEYRKSQ
jgi:thiamine biosynthesis lipoprotein ApbE